MQIKTICASLHFSSQQTQNSEEIVCRRKTKINVIKNWLNVNYRKNRDFVFPTENKTNSFIMSSSFHVQKSNNRDFFSEMLFWKSAGNRRQEENLNKSLVTFYAISAIPPNRSRRYLHCNMPHRKATGYFTKLHIITIKCGYCCLI